MSRFNYLQGER